MSAIPLPRNEDGSHAAPDIATINVPDATWNAILGSTATTIAVELMVSVLVDPAPCSSPLSIVRVTYGGGEYDCNTNGTQDLCEIANGVADCDQDGALDACEIANGALDKDNDGRPDACEEAYLA